MNLKFAVEILTLSLAVTVHAAEIHVRPGGPIRTLAEAQREARKTGANTVVLHAGTYPLTRTLELDARDSGVTWKGEGALISGALVVPPSAVKRVTDPATLERLLPEVRGKVCEIDLRPLGITDLGEVGPHGFGHPYIPAPVELFADGRPMGISQWPKQGEQPVRMGKVIDKGSVPRMREKPDRGGVFEFNSDRPLRWTKANDLWITGLFNLGYADDLLRVASIDPVKKTFTTAKPHVYGFGSGKPWNNWTALNLLEELSLPGEYMLERSSVRIYFLPPENKDVSAFRYEVSVMKDPLVSINGAKGVVFDGVDFGFSRDMGVYIEGGSGNRIRNSTLRNLGTVAVCIGKIQPDKESTPNTAVPDRFMVNPKSNRSGGTDNGLEHCIIRDVGAGGVLLGGGDRATLQPAGNFIENCDIDHFNRWDRTYRGAVNIDGVGNRIRHCVMHDSPGLIILLHGNDHLIEYNEIHHGILVGDDMGAFYMGRDPTERGNILRYNYWHDLGPAHHTYGLYLDDMGGDGTVVFGNVFRNVGYSGAVFVNGGCDIKIENNIFIDSPSKQNGALRGNPSTANMQWSSNVAGFTGILKSTPLDKSPWRDRYPELVDYLAFKNSTGDTRGLCFAKNLLINSSMNPCKFTVTNNWSTQGDPGFVDASKGNYALNPDSEVFKQIPGFQPIPFDRIGIERPQTAPH